MHRSRASSATTATPNDVQARIPACRDFIVRYVSRASREAALSKRRSAEDTTGQSTPSATSDRAPNGSRWQPLARLFSLAAAAGGPLKQSKCGVRFAHPTCISLRVAHSRVAPGASGSRERLDGVARRLAREAFIEMNAIDLHALGMRIVGRKNRWHLTAQELERPVEVAPLRQRAIVLEELHGAVNDHRAPVVH